MFAAAVVCSRVREIVGAWRVMTRGMGFMGTRSIAMISELIGIVFAHTCQAFTVQDSGIVVHNLGIRVQGSRDLEFFSGSGFGVWGLGFRV